MRRVPFLAAYFAAIAACALSTRSFAECRLRVMAEFPVTMVGSEAVVVVQINGADVPVVLDSGATFDLLSYAAAASLHLARQSPSGHPFIQGVGGAGGGRLFALAVANVRLGGARISGAKFIVSDLRVDGPVAGFIGRDILDDYDIDYDLPRHVIKLMRPSGCRNVAPVYWARSRPYQTSDVAHDGSSRTVIGRVNGVELRVMFDTGASSTILDVRAAARAGVSPSSDGAIAGNAVRGVGGGSKKIWVVPIAKVAIAGEEIRNTHLRIGELSLPQVDMVLGSDFFLSHHVYFANSQHKIYFTYEGGPAFDRAP
jgi:predicted aspartyl protease